MQEIYLDSYHLHSLTTSLPTGLKQGVEGLEFPEVRQDVYNRPGEHGSRTAHTFYGPRPITLEGVIRASTVAAYRAARQDFVNACSLSLDSSNLPIVRTLKLTDTNGGAYQVA